MLACANPARRADFALAAVGPLRQRDTAVDLLNAVVASAQYGSREAAAKALGVVPATVTARRRRAAEASGLDDGDPLDRHLLLLAAVAADVDSHR